MPLRAFPSTISFAIICLVRAYCQLVDECKSGSLNPTPPTIFLLKCFCCFNQWQFYFAVHLPIFLFTLLSWKVMFPPVFFLQIIKQHPFFSFMGLSSISNTQTSVFLQSDKLCFQFFRLLLIFLFFSRTSYFYPFCLFVDRIFFFTFAPEILTGSRKGALQKK